MKAKTLIITAVLSTSLIAPCLGQATFSRRAFNTGDTTITWDVTGSMFGTGVLTATTNGGDFFSGGQGVEASFEANEGPARDVVWSFTANEPLTVINTNITSRITSLGLSNTFSFSEVGIVTENEGSYWKDPARTVSDLYVVGDTVANVYGTNQGTNLRFTSADLGTMSYTGNEPTLGTVAGISFDIIPEPSGVALLGVGSFAFLLRRRR